jgi:GMP synthase (glutamine-hydrolysing)
MDRLTQATPRTDHRTESRPSATKATESHAREAVRPDAIAVLDFGSQTAQLIARRVREIGVYCELVAHDAPPEPVGLLAPRGYILSGGPASVYASGAPQLPSYVLESGRPVLGICYGMQLLAHALGGQVDPSERREYGLQELQVLDHSPLFAGLPPALQVWMSHGDRVTRLPRGFAVLGHSGNSPVAVMGDQRRGYYGVQFHPEVLHTPQGTDLLRNFVLRVCGCRPNWTPAAFVETAVGDIKARVGDGQVVAAVSGGVDSSVMAALLQRAVGDRFQGVFVDHGLLRQRELDEARELFEAMHLTVRFVDAGRRFLAALAGVDDPEDKRRIVGELFVRTFEQAAAKSGARFLAQGTLYPDVIESTTPETRAAERIKTHHNVGGLPEDMQFELIEPLRFLFKDEVRAVGRQLGLPERVVKRQPFPGPGLAVRILGPVTAERLDLLRAADAIVRHEIEAAADELADQTPWQYFAVLVPARSVGVMGDKRTYGQAVVIRAVTSEDGMTADWAQLPVDLLTRMATRIVNEVSGVNRVVYDITSKPPATIEWE